MRFCAFVLLPCAVAAAYAWRSLHASLPPASGSVVVDGLSAPVEIHRDERGIPYVHARTDNDAFFGAGYVHAQDRLWQLELQRRMVNGRLSEVFGRASINQDIWLRTLGLREAAKSAWQTLSPEAKASLSAYTAGINAYLSEHRQLPPEFRLLGITPEPWTELDSLGWNNMFALTMGGNFREEISRFVASQYLSTDKLQALFPGDPAGAPITVTAAERAQTPKLAALGNLQQTLEAQLKLGGKYVGSNAWVVSGKLTGDGQSILANDPHLAIQVPSLWYGMRLKGEHLDVTGMSLVGLPVIIFGRNGEVAWGGTNMMADQQDLYFERVNPDNANEYEVNGHWEKFVTRSETINVKPDFPAFLRGPLKPVIIEVRSTRHGPIVSDQFHVFDEPVALRWSLLQTPVSSSYESFYRVNFARDWTSFNAAFRDYVAPALNLLYSDRQGNIGYVGVGKIPIRARGQGTLPVPGWNDDYDWRGSIPFAEMPRSFNPEKGYIVSANNRVTSPDYPYFISNDWAPQTRAVRIEQLIRQKLVKEQHVTVADMEAIQGDVADAPSAALVKVMVRIMATTERQRQAVRYLQQWNGSMARNSVGATLFYAWADHLRREVFSDELQGAWNRRDETRYLDPLVDRMQEDELAGVLTNDRLEWCDDKQTTDRKETCHQDLISSLNATLTDLAKVHGSNMAKWSWGNVHSTRYEHTPFSQTNLLRKLFQREVANGGAPNSINVATASFRETEGYVQTFGAGFRQIITSGPGAGEHFYMNSTGQSGNVMSPHYDDMVVPFRDVTYFPFHDDTAAGRNTTFTLQPR